MAIGQARRLAPATERGCRAARLALWPSDAGPAWNRHWGPSPIPKNTRYSTSARWHEGQPTRLYRFQAYGPATDRNTVRGETKAVPSVLGVGSGSAVAAGGEVWGDAIRSQKERRPFSFGLSEVPPNIPSPSTSRPKYTRRPHRDQSRFRVGSRFCLMVVGTDDSGFSGRALHLARVGQPRQARRSTITLFFVACLPRR